MHTIFPHIWQFLQALILVSLNYIQHADQWDGIHNLVHYSILDYPVPTRLPSKFCLLCILCIKCCSEFFRHSSSTMTLKVSSGVSKLVEDWKLKFWKNQNIIAYLSSLHHFSVERLHYTGKANPWASVTLCRYYGFSLSHIDMYRRLTVLVFCGTGYVKSWMQQQMQLHAKYKLHAGTSTAKQAHSTQRHFPTVRRQLGHLMTWFSVSYHFTATASILVQRPWGVFSNLAAFHFF